MIIHTVDFDITNIINVKVSQHCFCKKYIYKSEWGVSESMSCHAHFL